MTNADVDVIIPAYNAEATIGEAIASALDQTLQPVGVIVVDDGSTDGTAARAAVAGGDRVRLVTQRNGGQGGARDAGARVSTADRLVFLDADDLLEPDAIEVLGRALSAAPDAPLVFGRGLPFRDPPDPSLPAASPVDERADLTWERLLQSNFIRSPGCAMIRRAALAAAGGWDPDRRLQGHEDWDLWLRLIDRGPLLRVGQATLGYRLHPDSFTTNVMQMKRSYLATLAKTAARLAGDPGRGRRAADMWRGARSHLGHETRHAARAAVAAKEWATAARLVAAAVAIDPLFPPRKVIRGLRWSGRPA